MPGDSQENRQKYNRKLAFCGVMAGLGTALLLTGGLIPGAAYCAPLLAGLMLIPVRLECGARWGWLCWAATALLALLLSADRETAFFYGFLGYYPLVKPGLDRLRSRLVRLSLKTAVFAAAITAMYAVLCLVLRLESVMEDFGAAGLLLNVVFFVLLTACMLLYDRALGPITQLYCRRIRPKLHRLH